MFAALYGYEVYSSSSPATLQDECLSRWAGRHRAHWTELGGCLVEQDGRWIPEVEMQR